MQRKPRKRFGQNFLRNPNIARKIITTIAPKPEEHIVEIGPGEGALTKQLLPLVHELDAIELDKHLIEPLKLACTNLGNLNLYEADALKFNFNRLKMDVRKLRIIGNLPYNISTPLLFHLLNYAEIIEDMTFTLQKEVVDRIVAKPGSKTYGRLSVMLQYACQTEYLFKIPANAFYPIPKVTSAVVRLMPLSEPISKANDETIFKEIVRLAFTQRRKTLRNCLKTMITDEQWATLQINPTARPEQLRVEDFVKISNIVI